MTLFPPEGFRTNIVWKQYNGKFSHLSSIFIIFIHYNCDNSRLVVVEDYNAEFRIKRVKLRMDQRSMLFKYDINFTDSGPTLSYRLPIWLIYD